MEIEASREAIKAVSADEAAMRAEQHYTAELQRELAGRADIALAKHPEEALEQSMKVKSLPLHKVVPLATFSKHLLACGALVYVWCNPGVFGEWPPV